MTDYGIRGLGFTSPCMILTSRIETCSLPRVVRDGGDSRSVPLSGRKKVANGGVFDLVTTVQKIILKPILKTNDIFYLNRQSNALGQLCRVLYDIW